MQIKSKIYLIFFFICYAGCFNPFIDDIYRVVPKGARLTKEILSKADQIIPNGNELIVMLDIGKADFEYSPHLLFYDSTLTLVGACYFASEKVILQENNVIQGDVNESRIGRVDNFRNEVPKTYTIQYTKSKSSRGCGMSNKVVDKITVNSEKLDLQIRQSKNEYAGINWENSQHKKIKPAEFTKLDTLSMPLSELLLSNEESTIIRTSWGKNNCYARDHMIVLERSVMDKFYDDLWAWIQATHPSK